MVTGSRVLSTARRPFATAVWGARRPNMRRTNASVSHRHVTSVIIKAVSCVTRGRFPRFRSGLLPSDEVAASLGCILAKAGSRSAAPSSTLVTSILEVIGGDEGKPTRRRVPGAGEGSKRAWEAAFLSGGWLGRHTGRESSGQDMMIDSVPECPYYHQGYGWRVLRTPPV